MKNIPNNPLSEHMIAKVIMHVTRPNSSKKIGNITPRMNESIHIMEITIAIHILRICNLSNKEKNVKAISSEDGEIQKSIDICLHFWEYFNGHDIWYWH